MILSKWEVQMDSPTNIKTPLFDIVEKPDSAKPSSSLRLGSYVSFRLCSLLCGIGLRRSGFFENPFRFLLLSWNFSSCSFVIFHC